MQIPLKNSLDLNKAKDSENHTKQKRDIKVFQMLYKISSKLLTYVGQKLIQILDSEQFTRFEQNSCEISANQKSFTYS